jgi:antitoxin component of MazEF toxin-antitoxin module
MVCIPLATSHQAIILLHSAAVVLPLTIHSSLKNTEMSALNVMLQASQAVIEPPEPAADHIQQLADMVSPPP